MHELLLLLDLEAVGRCDPQQEQLFTLDLYTFAEVLDMEAFALRQCENCNEMTELLV